DVPYPAAESRGVYLKHAVRGAMDIAMVGVAVLITPDAAKKAVRDVRIGLGAVAPTPIRAAKAEASLRGKPLTPALLKQGGARRIGSEPDRRSAQQRRIPPLDRRGSDATRLGAKLESRDGQGGSVMSFTINATINDKKVSASTEASTSLLEFLRDTLEM